MGWRTRKPYLAGTMANLKGFGAGWRASLRAWFARHGLSAYDPCVEETKEHRKYDFKKVDKNKWEALPQPLQEEILVKDLDQIKYHTNFVICFFTRYSTGTVSELTFAFYNRIPVYIVTTRKLVGWPMTVAKAEGNKVFRTFDELKRYLVVKHKLRKKA